MLISFFANIETAFTKGLERLNSNKATPKNEYFKYSLFKFDQFFVDKFFFHFFLIWILFS